MQHGQDRIYAVYHYGSSDINLWEISKRGKYYYGVIVYSTYKNAIGMDGEASSIEEFGKLLTKEEVNQLKAQLL